VTVKAEPLDPITMLEIRLYAATRAAERIPSQGEHRIADFITRDDYRHGVRRAFREGEGFEEWMVTPLLRAFDEAEALERLCSVTILAVLAERLAA
jgi:hypothetical protein